MLHYVPESTICNANRKWFDPKTNSILKLIVLCLFEITYAPSLCRFQGKFWIIQQTNGHGEICAVGSSIIIRNKNIINATYCRSKVWLMCTAHGKSILYCKFFYVFSQTTDFIRKLTQFSWNFVRALTARSW